MSSEHHLSFPEVPFLCERLTGAQRQVLAALAAGYTVCRASGGGMRDGSCVLLGNGTRLARITVDSLEYRELIEVASKVDDPNQRFRCIFFYQLSKRGWHEVVRQKIGFAADVVEVVLPVSISEIYREIERYVTQYQVEALVEVKGTKFEYHQGQQLLAAAVPKWAAVVAFDEKRNALGLGKSATLELQSTPLPIEWVDLRYFTTGKLRLSPLST